MNPQDFKRPQRVWVNAPSTLQVYHKLHGRVGIAVLDQASEQVYIYFTEGSVVSQQIDPLYLSRK